MKSCRCIRTMGIVREPHPSLIHPRSSGGFSLVELMVSVGVSSIVTLVTGGIIVNAVKTMKAAGNNGQALSVVNNIRTELSDAKYASQVKTDAQNNPMYINGQPAMVGCSKSVAFDQTNMSATQITANLTAGQNSCVPVKITLTRSSGTNLTVISEENNAESAGQGTTYVKFLEFCNPTVVQSNSGFNEYAGELFITQNIERSNALGQLASSVMGAGYGARQFVSHLVVGVDQNANVVTCNAPANASLNGQNCAMAGMQFNSQTQSCQNIVVGPGYSALTTCTPITNATAINGQSATCVRIKSACSSGQVAGGFYDANLLCDRPASMGPQTTGNTITCPPGQYLVAVVNNLPVCEPFVAATNQSTNQWTSPEATTSTGSNSMPNVVGSINATLGTISQPNTIAVNCQAALMNYIACLTAQSRMSKYVNFNTYNGQISCTQLQNAVCSAVPVVQASTSGIGTLPVQQLLSPPPPATNCSCGSTSIQPGQYCGYCLSGIDAGYDTYTNAQKIEQCDPAGSGLLLACGSAGTTCASNPVITAGGHCSAVGLIYGRYPASRTSTNQYMIP